MMYFGFLVENLCIHVCVNICNEYVMRKVNTACVNLIEIMQRIMCQYNNIFLNSCHFEENQVTCAVILFLELHVGEIQILVSVKFHSLGCIPVPNQMHKMENKPATFHNKASKTIVGTNIVFLHTFDWMAQIVQDYVIHRQLTCLSSRKATNSYRV